MHLGISSFEPEWYYNKQMGAQLLRLCISFLFVWAVFHPCFSVLYIIFQPLRYVLFCFTFQSVTTYSSLLKSLVYLCLLPFDILFFFFLFFVLSFFPPPCKESWSFLVCVSLFLDLLDLCVISGFRPEVDENSLFWITTQRLVVISYRRFGTT